MNAYLIPKGGELYWVKSMENCRRRKHECWLCFFGKEEETERYWYEASGSVECVEGDYVGYIPRRYCVVGKWRTLKTAKKKVVAEILRRVLDGDARLVDPTLCADFKNKGVTK